MLAIRFTSKRLRRTTDQRTFRSSPRCHRRHPSQTETTDKNASQSTRQGQSASSFSPQQSLYMPLSLPHTREFWKTVEAASIALKRIASSSSLRKNYFALAANEKQDVSAILQTPATNATQKYSRHQRYKDYTSWFRMTLNRLAFMKDIQGNNLWKICHFQLGDFYRVAPHALENFHDVLGELQNHSFPFVTRIEFDKESDRIGSGLQEEVAKHRGYHKKPTFVEREVPHRKIGEFLRNHWHQQALNSPSSLPGELSRMVGHFVFNTCFSMCRRVAFELAQRNAQYRKGTCRVKRISVRSARTFWIPSERKKIDPLDIDNKDLEVYDDDAKFDLNYDCPSGVLVQIKTLYCLERTIEPRTAETSMEGGASDPEHVTEPDEEAYHCEATFEGWLHGGPEGRLQWRIIEFLDLNKNV